MSAQSGFFFGAGKLSIKDSSGNAHAIAALSDVSMEYSADVKVHHGGQMLPVAGAVVNGKLSGKAKFSKVDYKLIAGILGGSYATGQTCLIDEAVTAGASKTVANGATFVADFGVLDANGMPMKKVAATPAAGEYVPGGVGVGTYTFNASEAGTLTIRYSYTDSDGHTVTVSNRAVPSSSPAFELFAYDEFGANKVGVRLPAVLIPKLALLALKSEDFNEQEIDFQAVCDSTGKFLELYEE